MNDLAHFHLAAHHGGRDALVGALLGDYLKGPIERNWPGDWPGHWRQGVMLHRRIDALCDNHPLVVRERAEFSPEMRRYGGIVMDVAMDHLLAHHWHRFCTQPLPEFATAVYAALEPALPVMPEAARERARNLIRYDALTRFRDPEVVPATLARIGQRLSRRTPLLDAAPEFERRLPALESCFLDFYPELMRRVRSQGAALC